MWRCIKNMSTTQSPHTITASFVTTHLLICLISFQTKKLNLQITWIVSMLLKLYKLSKIVRNNYQIKYPDLLLIIPVSVYLIVCSHYIPFFRRIVNIWKIISSEKIFTGLKIIYREHYLYFNDSLLVRWFVNVDF